MDVHDPLHVALHRVPGRHAQAEPEPDREKDRRQSAEDPVHAQASRTNSKVRSPATRNTMSKPSRNRPWPRRAPAFARQREVRQLHGGEEDRHREGQQEDREQHLARPEVGGHGGEQGPHGGEPDRAGQGDQEQAGHRRPDVEVVEDPRRRDEDHLHRQHQCCRARELAEIDRALVGRRQDEPVEAVVLALEREGAAEPEDAGQDETRARTGPGARRGSARRRARGRSRKERGAGARRIRARWRPPSPAARSRGPSGTRPTPCGGTRSRPGLPPHTLASVAPR